MTDNKWCGKFVIFFCLLALCLPVSAETLHGGVSYTEETARQEAFEGVRPLSIVYSVGWESPKYFFDLNEQNDAIAITRTTAKIAGLPVAKCISVIYKDEPQKEYIYRKHIGKKYILSATITEDKNNTSFQRYLTYDRYGHLLSIQFLTDTEGFIYDKNRKIIAKWTNNQGKVIGRNIKMNQKIIYFAQ